MGEAVVIYRSCPRDSQVNQETSQKQEKTSWQKEVSVITYKSCVMKSEYLERNEQHKRIWKNFKKVLDKFDKMC